MTDAYSIANSGLSESESAVKAVPCACAEKPSELTTFTVLLAPLPAAHNWKPQSCRSPIQNQDGGLPQAAAIEAAKQLNAIYRKFGRCRIAVAVKNLNGSQHSGLVTVEAAPKSSKRAPVKLPNVQATGLNGIEAQAEVERINTLILQYAQIPKVWAIAALEYDKADEVSAGVAGEEVTA